MKSLTAVAVALSALTVFVLVRPGGSGAHVRPVRTSAIASPAARVAGAAQPLRAASIKAVATSTGPTPPVSTGPSRSRPAVNPCHANDEEREVLVSLADQHMWLCARHAVHADFPVTTGRSGDSTPTGTFDVQARTRNTTLNPQSGGSYSVRYWIPFKWGMFGFHDAPWQTIPFGSPRYRTQGSQGCVHMRMADIARLFGWVSLGTTVRVVAR